MKKTQQDLFTVKRDLEWNAINSAVRLEMLVFMIASGPCAIRELAELMDRPADALYHHLRQLLAAGLVVEVSTRKVGKQTEAVYQTIARDITIDRDLTHKKTRDRVIRLFRTMINHAQRTIEAAIKSREATLEQGDRNITLSWVAAWLDERQLAKVRHHQQAINQILQKGLTRRKGRLYAVLTYLTPIVRAGG